MPRTLMRITLSDTTLTVLQASLTSVKGGRVGQPLQSRRNNPWPRRIDLSILHTPHRMEPGLEATQNLSSPRALQSGLHCGPSLADIPGGTKEGQPSA